jgi:unsaturated rhamnogalacturonyl hydrolase
MQLWIEKSHSVLEHLGVNEAVHIPRSRWPGSSRMSVGAMVAFFAICTALAYAQRNAADVPSKVGDAPSNPQMRARLSTSLNQQDVGKALRKVADWELQRSQENFDQDWTFAALYAGFMAVPSSVAGDKYRAAMKGVGEKFRWELGPRPFHADDQAIGQAYLELYAHYNDPQMMKPTRGRMDTMIASPDPTEKPLWWWCDALFMAPPVLAKLSSLTKDTSYLKYMDREWWITSDLLYDSKEHLYFRDASFLKSREANGRPVFWSRGNGWVMAGLVRVLQQMPRDYPSRARYVEQLREMAAAVAMVQGKDDLWRPGLLDAQAYPLPENSGSAFITYALAYGVNEGILDRKEYEPRVKRAWAGLLSYVYADGRFGSIQPIGAAPDKYTVTSSYVFGVGAYLLAGSELYRMAGK